MSEDASRFEVESPGQGHPSCRRAFLTSTLALGGAVAGLGWLRPHGVEAVWRAFLREPDSPLWTRAFTL